jgi:SRSO17 transposase
MTEIGSRIRNPKLAIRRFLDPVRAAFTTRPDGSSWARATNTWQMARAYVEGLVRPGSHKTLRGIGKRMDVHEDRVRRFITQSPWEPDALQDHLNHNIPDSIASAEAMLIFDDVDFRKKGDHSVGVARQYAGSVGKVDNCQVAVDLVSAVPGEARNANQVTWPLGMDLYLPQPWIEDESYAELRDEVGLPEDVEFRTKPNIALELIERARSANVPHTCVGADAGYGDDRELRSQLRAWKEPYILGVTPSELRVVPAETPVRPPGPTDGPGRARTHPTYPEDVEAVSPREIAADVENWNEVTWSEGTKGALSSRFYRQRVRVVSNTQLRWVSEEEAWLLVEDRGNEIKAWLCWGLDEWSLEELVAYAHVRWPIEQFHKDAKQVLGMDQFEGRTWTGWNHHVSVVLLTYSFLMTERAARDAAARLPPFSQVARIVIYEMAVRTVEEEGLDRETAERVAESMLRGFTDW